MNSEAQQKVITEHSQTQNPQIVDAKPVEKYLQRKFDLVIVDAQQPQLADSFRVIIKGCNAKPD